MNSDKKSHDDLPGYPTALFLTLLFLVILLKLSSFSIAPAAKEILLKFAGKATTGEVSDTFSKTSYGYSRSGIKHRETTEYVIIDYRLDTRRFVNEHGYEAGQRVPVTYLPILPAVAMAGPPRSLLAIVGITSFSGIGILVLSTFCLALFSTLFLLCLGVALYRRGYPVDRIWARLNKAPCRGRKKRRSTGKKRKIS